MNEYVALSASPDYSPSQDTDTANQTEVSLSTVSSSHPIHGAEVRRIAQEMHTAAYLENGFIADDQLNSEGVFIDEYSNRSYYVVSRQGNRQSACRYIDATRKDGMLSLPTAQHFSLDPDTLKEAAGVNRLSDLRARDVIEVSGLASVLIDSDESTRSSRVGQLDATRLLYASILRHSLDEGHKLWLLNTDKRLLRSLEMLIGKEQVYRLGDETAYMGPATIPVAINPQEVVKAAFADTSEFGQVKQQYLREELPGVGAKHLAKETRAALTENGIAITEQGPIRGFVKRYRKAIAYTAIVGYSSARALPVSGIEEFNGSVPLFWGIDVATAFPYTWGLVEMAAAKKPSRRVVGGAVAAGSFVAPYAYFWSEGQDYPVYVNAVAGSLIGLATTLEVSKLRKDRRVAARLQASPVPDVKT